MAKFYTQTRDDHVRDICYGFYICMGRRYENKKAVLPQGNRAMPQVFFSVEVRQQHSLQV